MTGTLPLSAVTSRPGSWVVALVAALSCLAPARASAHPVPFSYLDVHLDVDAIRVTLVAHIFDLAHDLNVTAPEQLLDANVVQQRANALTTLLTPRFELATEGRALTPKW